MKHIILAFLVCFAIISCKKDESPEKSKNANLVGNWINPIYIDTLITYERADNLIENQYGMAFNSDNSVIERKNNSWCGTPPIVTSDYAGTWKWNDSIVDISVGYWGGTAEYSWEIISLDNQKLVVTIRNQKFSMAK